MSSEKPSHSVEERELEVVELHRAESMSKQDPELRDQLITNAAAVEDKHGSATDPAGSRGNQSLLTRARSLLTRARSLISRIPPLTAELVMFLYMFSSSMRAASSTNMILDKVCLVHLGYSEDVCGHLKDHLTIKSEVTKLANNYVLGLSMIQMLPSSVMALFVGSWSDKYGRKFPMILALTGIIIDGFGSSFCAYFLRSRVEFYYIPAMFTGISGGFIGTLTILYSYASDISTAGNRTMKYAIMELAFGLSMPLGALAGGWVFKFFGYVPVFASSTCGHVMALCIVIFVLRETRGLEVREGWLVKFRSFWSLEGVKSSLKTTAKRRPNKGRAQIWFLILAMSVVVFSYASQGGITFLFVHFEFDWDNAYFSTVNSVYMVIGFTLMMIIVPLSKKFNVADPFLGILGSVSLLMKNVATGLATRPWIFHVAMVSGLLNSLATLAGRSRISKIIPKDDLGKILLSSTGISGKMCKDKSPDLESEKVISLLHPCRTTLPTQSMTSWNSTQLFNPNMAYGKVFAFVSTAESLLPIAASAIVSQAFNATLDFFPGLIFLIMGILTVIPIGVFAWISRLPVISNEETSEGNQHVQEVKVQAVEVPSTTKK